MFTSFLTLANYRQIKIARTILLNKAFLCSCLSCKQITGKLNLSPEWDVFHIASSCCRVKWLNPFLLWCLFYQS